MPRFYIDSQQLQKREPRVTGKDVRHIRKVLRLSAGDKIELTDGRGRIFDASIAAFEENAVRVAILNEIEVHNESPLELTVAQGFLKDKKMDDLIRQITELGVSRWIPMITERAVARPDEKRMEKRLGRWQDIALEAIKQCGRSTVPEIDSVMNFSEVIDLSETVDLPVFFWEHAETPIITNPVASPKSVLLMLGPEGGFTAREADLAKRRGLAPATLGSRILRAETAAVAASTLVQYLFGDLQKSP